MADSKEKLFSDFPAVSTEQWMEKITADLKGADFEKKLVWRTNEGFKVNPFYRQDDLAELKTTEGLRLIPIFKRLDEKRQFFVRASGNQSRVS